MLFPWYNFTEQVLVFYFSYAIIYDKCLHVIPQVQPYRTSVYEDDTNRRPFLHIQRFHTNSSRFHTILRVQLFHIWNFEKNPCWYVLVHNSIAFSNAFFFLCIHQVYVASKNLRQRSPIVSKNLRQCSPIVSMNLRHCSPIVSKNLLQCSPIVSKNLWQCSPLCKLKQSRLKW